MTRVPRYTDNAQPTYAYHRNRSSFNAQIHNVSSIDSFERTHARVRRDILFHIKEHPNKLGRSEIKTFLTHLA